MPLVEAVLMYQPQGFGADVRIPIAKTRDPGALRAVRERILSEMEEVSGSWGAVDPGVAAMEEAEADRVRRLLALLLPDEELKPGLRLLEQDHGEQE